MQQHGGKITLSTKVKSITVKNKKLCAVETNDGVHLEAKAVIIATNTSQAISLLSPDYSVNAPVEYPICTVYLQYAAEVRLKAPMLGMSGTISQWLFDRSEQTPGLIAVVISGPGKHEKLSKEALITLVCREVHQLFPEMPEYSNHAFVIREKRATFASSVDIESNAHNTKRV
ncbi:MAG: FAD-dependent oxidoreductase [Gammaproteobacteria bacterium]|nr:FAD-dependent oxidoreductase [Gammaproteobacteria bacterium]